MYDNLHTRINLLKGKSKKFISWICPLLNVLVTTQSEFIYCEGDQVKKIFMIKSGSCDFVLPSFLNSKILKIPEG